MPNKIFIVTGTIQSGKTSSLKQWLKSKENVYGILTPVVQHKRCFMDVQSNEIFAMEPTINDVNDYLPVGKYIFSKKAFIKAIHIIDTALYQTQPYILIDEIGPLELQGLGFASVLNKALSTNNINLIVVIRDTLVQKVVSSFTFNTQLITYLNNQSNFNNTIK